MVSLPFIGCNQNIKNNFLQSKNRLLSLINRMKNQPDVLKAYAKIFEEQESNEIISDVTNEKRPTQGNFFYMPHHGVIRPDSTTTRLRIVYDASAKSGENL